jgi:carbonic anhydrase
MDMTSREALKKLTQGNKRFVTDMLDGALQDSVRRQAVVGGQSPYAIILSCADSRVVPELVFDTGIGELFVVRVAGNIANTSSIASIEYAVAHLGVKLIVVLGHQSCGAVSAAISGGDNGHNLNHLVAHLQPALQACPGGSVDAVVRENALQTSTALVERSQIIREAVQSGLEVLPAWYVLESGEVEYLQ